MCTTVEVAWKSATRCHLYKTNNNINCLCSCSCAVSYCEVLVDKSTLYIRVTLY